MFTTLINLQKNAQVTNKIRFHYSYHSRAVSTVNKMFNTTFPSKQMTDIFRMVSMEELVGLLAVTHGGRISVDTCSNTDLEMIGKEKQKDQHNKIQMVVR